MSRATVELDFFGPQNNGGPPSESQFHRLLRRQRSLRDIQGAISRIDPQVLKSVIASGSANQSPPPPESKSTAAPSSPKQDSAAAPPTLPLFANTPRPAAEKPVGMAPLTIFYNGTVVVFDVARDKAENILKLAENGLSSSSAPADQQPGLDSINGADLPMARRKSLQRFLEKRKERLTTFSPYACF